MPVPRPQRAGATAAVARPQRGPADPRRSNLTLQCHQHMHAAQGRPAHTQVGVMLVLLVLLM
jgi:hypothetical protein